MTSWDGSIRRDMPADGLVASLALHAAAVGAALWLASPAAPFLASPGIAVPVTIVLQPAAAVPAPPARGPVHRQAARPAANDPDPAASGAPTTQPLAASPLDSASTAAPIVAPTPAAALPNPARKPAAPDMPAIAVAALKANAPPSATAETLPASAAPASAAVPDAADAIPVSPAMTAVLVPLVDDSLGNPPPIYPRQARRLGQQGTVLLRVRISATGQVLGIEVAGSSGHELLDMAARDAVRNWRFQPARQGTSAVEGIVEVPVSFRLRG